MDVGGDSLRPARWMARMPAEADRDRRGAEAFSLAEDAGVAEAEFRGPNPHFLLFFCDD